MMLYTQSIANTPRIIIQKTVHAIFEKRDDTKSFTVYQFYSILING